MRKETSGGKKVVRIIVSVEIGVRAHQTLKNPRTLAFCMVFVCLFVCFLFVKCICAEAVAAY